MSFAGEKNGSREVDEVTAAALLLSSCAQPSSELSLSRHTMIEDKENKDHSLERSRVTLILSLKNEVGGLIKALKIFQVWLSHKAHLKTSLWNTIESVRFSQSVPQRWPSEVFFKIDFY